MSQLSSTVFGSWGLMVGWNIAPPPPGPMISKFPGRCAAPLIATRRVRVSRNKNKTICCFPLLSLSFFRFLFGRNSLFCQCSAWPCGDLPIFFWLCLSSAEGGKLGGEGDVAQFILLTWLACS